jgi:hypothetical protein
LWDDVMLWRGVGLCRRGKSANCPSDIENRADKGNHDIIGNGAAFFAAFCPSYMPIDSAALEHDIFVTACHV